MSPGNLASSRYVRPSFEARVERSAPESWPNVEMTSASVAGKRMVDGVSTSVVSVIWGRVTGCWNPPMISLDAKPMNSSHNYYGTMARGPQYIC